jgi:hypothetical protein
MAPLHFSREAIAVRLVLADPCDQARAFGGGSADVRAYRAVLLQSLVSPQGFEP